MKRIWLVGLISVIILTSCGSVSNKRNNNGESNVVFQNNINKDNEPIDMDTMKEEVLDLETYSLKNNSAKDGQPDFLFNGAAVSELGIYYWDRIPDELGGEKLMFFDKASKTSIVLCNRPNCTHADDACNASFYAHSDGKIQFYKDRVYYYEDSVFLVGHDEESFVNLYKVTADGSSWEKYMTLFKAEMTVTTDDSGGTSVFWSYPSVSIHQGYVYYIDNSESTQKLRRIPMGGKETEVVFEPDGEKTMVYRMKTYGDFVFFQAGKYVGDAIDAGIFAYNTKSEEVFLVKKDVLREYYVVEDSLYYQMNETICKYQLNTGENMKLPISNTGIESTFFANSEGLYFFNENSGELEVFDDAGNLKGSIQDSGVGSCYFGADGFFVGENYNESKMCFFEEKTLYGDNGKWLYGQ